MTKLQLAFLVFLLIFLVGFGVFFAATAGKRSSGSAPAPIIYDEN